QHRVGPGSRAGPRHGGAMRRFWIDGVRGVLVGGVVLWAAGAAEAQPGSVVGRASVSGGGTQANANSFSSTLSGDGRGVALASSATNLGGGCASGQQIYVHDRATGATSCVSVDGGGVPGNAGSDTPALSADGRFVAFASSATNLGGGCASSGQV